MIIKIGNIELKDWANPRVNGINWTTPYRFVVGTIFDGSHYTEQPFQERTMVLISANSLGKKYPEFWGDLRVLGKNYQPEEPFSSYEEAQRDVDQFLQRMSRLIAFA